MVALMCFVLAVLALPFKSKSRLEAENAALRHQLIVLRRKVRGRAQLSNNDRWFFVQLYRWFSVDPRGRHDPPSRDVGALASGRLSPLLALEIALTRRAPANRDRTARVDPADELGEFALGCAAHSRRTAQAWV